MTGSRTTAGYRWTPIIVLVGLALTFAVVPPTVAAASTTPAQGLIHAYDVAAKSRVDAHALVPGDVGDRDVSSVEESLVRDGRFVPVGASSRRPGTRIATNSARGLSDFGGVIEQTGTNAAGGRVFTSTGGIEQSDFAGIVNSGLMRGEEVTILTGAHGAADGSIAASQSMLAADVGRFGSLPGVRVRDVSTMSRAEIQAAMNGPGTIIGAFCNSGACLAALGGG